MAYVEKVIEKVHIPICDKCGEHLSDGKTKDDFGFLRNWAIPLIFKKLEGIEVTSKHGGVDDEIALIQLRLNFTEKKRYLLCKNCANKFELWLKE
jgi:hypothetical protein